MSSRDPAGRRRCWCVGAGLCLSLVAAGCAAPSGSDDAAGDPSPPASSPTAAESPTRASPSSTPRESSPPRPVGTAVTADDSDFGRMLFDRRGQAIYLFEPEADGTPACYDECAAAWPPVLTEGAPRARGEVTAELLGTVRRRDGARQVTYNGWPLYFYAHEGPGEVLCHDVFLNGGLWLALGPDGRPLPG